MGGKGFNQAVAIALATGGGHEGKVSFYGTVGDDEAGKGLKEKLLSRWGLKNDSLFLDSVSFVSGSGLNICRFVDVRNRQRRLGGRLFKWLMMVRIVSVRVFFFTIVVCRLPCLNYI